jgi:hypothetical protein
MTNLTAENDQKTKAMIKPSLAKRNVRLPHVVIMLCLKNVYNHATLAPLLTLIDVPVDCLFMHTAVVSVAYYKNNAFRNFLLCLKKKSVLSYCLD